MNRTLNQLIEAAVLGGEEAEQSAPETVKVASEAPAPAPTSDDFGDVEKIASALEFLGRRGISSFLTKESMSKAAMCNKCGGKAIGGKCSKCGHKVKKASVHGDGNVGTNAGTKPGLPSPADGVDTGTSETATHVPELASNEAAIAYDKRTKAKRTSAALQNILDYTPFSDGKLKENISAAAEKGDKNINKSAHDLAAVRAELERRAAGRA